MYAIYNRRHQKYMALYLEKDMQAEPYSDGREYAVVWGELSLATEYSDLIFLSPKEDVVDTLIDTGTYDVDQKYVVTDWSMNKSDLIKVKLA